MPSRRFIDYSLLVVPESAEFALVALVGLLAVAVRARLRLTALAHLTLSLALSLAGVASAQTPVPVDDHVSTSMSGLILDRASGSFVSRVRVRNTSQETLSAPLTIVVTSISNGSVTLANASGAGVDGPFVAATLPVSGLTPGAAVDLQLAFANPSRSRFTFAASVRAVLQESGISFAVRRAALDGLAATLTAARNLPKADQHKALAEFVAQHPEFSEAGTTGDNFWAVFSDGREVVVFDNRPPGDSVGPADPGPPPAPVTLGSPAAPVAIAAPPERDVDLPEFANARLISAMGPGYRDVRQDIGSWLMNRQYTTQLLDGSVENMKGIGGGDGVVFISAHGGLGRPVGPLFPQANTYVVATSTLMTPAAEVTYKDDLDKGRLLYAVYPGELDRTDPNFPDGKPLDDEVTYGITSTFVDTYWTDFGSHAFVYIDVCSSRSYQSVKFYLAVLGKKASVYAGWDGSVGDGFSAKTAQLMFDRLLGTNQAPAAIKKSPPQRPFNYRDAQSDLKNHGLAKEGFTSLGFETCLICGQTFGMLAPSIAFMQTVALGDGSGSIFIVGTFGNEEGEVTIGGNPIDVRSWSPHLIEANLPEPGPASSGTWAPGSAGDVRVRVRNHQSNGAMLSGWRGDFTITGEPGSEIAPNYTIVFSKRFRADVREVRSNIHDPPHFLERGGDQLGSTWRWSCTGTKTLDSGIYSWSGGRAQEQIPYPWVLAGLVGPARSVKLLFPDPPGECTEMFVADDGHVEGPTVLPVLAVHGIVFLELPVIFGSDLEFTGDSTPKKLLWDGYTDGPTVKMSWPTIQNDFPPDPNEGR